MELFETGRWPSVWDAATLQQTIRQIVEAGDEFNARFYQTGDLHSPFACQGDIVEFRNPLPYFDENGNVAMTGDEFQHWMILGNTCDMDRIEVDYSTIVPLSPLQDAESRLPVLRSYEYYRQFYVPPWEQDFAQEHRVALFVQPATINKSAFRDDCARVIARLSFPAWALLHTCLIRYLARDDGRFE